MSQSKLKSLLYVLSIPLGLIAIVGTYIGLQIITSESKSTKDAKTMLLQAEQLSSLNEPSFASAVVKYHSTFNTYLCYGKSDNFTNDDWASFTAELTATQSAFQTLLNDEQVPQDAEKDVEHLLKVIEIAKEEKDMQGLLYGHRILHDLDKAIGSPIKEPFFGATYFADEGSFWNRKRIESYVK